MRITFKPKNEAPQGTHLLAYLHPASKPFAQWTYGETKDVPDDLIIPINEGGVRRRIRLVDELLSSPMFMPAEEPVNPDFTCARCGQFTIDEAIPHPFNAELDEGIPLEIDGEPVCRSCFDAAHPHYTRTGVDFNRQQP